MWKNCGVKMEKGVPDRIFSFSVVELERAAEHVVYEFRQFAHARVHFAKLRGTPNPDMALEFRVLHQRILLEFFHTTVDERRERNILAADYITGWDATRPEWYRSYIERCHRLLAHISLDRSVLAKDWSPWWGSDPAQDVERHLLRQIQKFLKRLPGEFKPGFRSQFLRYPDGAQTERLLGPDWA